MENKLASSLLRAGRFENAKEVIIEHGRQGSIIKINNGLDQESFRMSQAGLAELKSQLKRLFGLDERDLAIGKRAKIRLGKNLVSACLSAVNSGEGEKIRIEFLSEKPEVRPLSRLGLDSQGQKLFSRALLRPGLIVISGLAGEGSSTTAYSLLAHLAGHDKAVAALESFPELTIDGVSHLTKDNRKLSEQLRRLKRSDQDAIFIADANQKELLSGLELAKEGHLVIVETKAEGTKPIISALGLEKKTKQNWPEITISWQRLVNNNCRHCAKRYRVNARELANIFPGINTEVGQDDVSALFSAGCPRCSYRGYTKRLAAFELASFDPRPTPPLLKLRPLMVDVFRKFTAGTTSAKEAARLNQSL